MGWDVPLIEQGNYSFHRCKLLIFLQPVFSDDVVEKFNNIHIIIHALSTSPHRRARQPMRHCDESSIARNAHRHTAEAMKPNANKTLPRLTPRPPPSYVESVTSSWESSGSVLRLKSALTVLAHDFYRLVDIRVGMLDIKIEVDRTHQRPLGVGQFFGIIFELLLGVGRGWVGVETTVVDQRGVQRETARVSSMIGRAKSTDAKFRVSFTSKRHLVLRTDRSVKHVFLLWSKCGERRINYYLTP